MTVFVRDPGTGRFLLENDLAETGAPAQVEPQSQKPLTAPETFVSVVWL